MTLLEERTVESAGAAVGRRTGGGRRPTTTPERSGMNALRHLPRALDGATARWRRAASMALVIDGVEDEAPEYVNALVALTEPGDSPLQEWWRAHGRGALQLRCEIWGADAHIRLSREAGQISCVIQRAPETTWGGQDSVELAREDLDAAFGRVAEALWLPPPPALRAG